MDYGIFDVTAMLDALTAKVRTKNTEEARKAEAKRIYEAKLLEIEKLADASKDAKHKRELVKNLINDTKKANNYQRSFAYRKYTGE